MDKTAFLARTARTAAIRDLAAHDDRVRVLGDIAAIHARTSPVAAGGEQQEGRYTGVWAKRGGERLAVSARVAR